MRETVPGLTPPPAASGPGEWLAAEMEAAWRRGERRPAEHYFSRHPELLDSSVAAVRLVYEEVCLREERGEPVGDEELRRRFPRWADELAVMLDCHRLVEARLAPPLLPSAGEPLGDFQLLAELGRGARSRVFLAAHAPLADRLVVLKVSPRQDREFLSLARLQHTHIIPLYGAYDFPERNLRALCQPYAGGATLARLLELMRPVPPERRTGRTLIDALDRAGEGLPPAVRPGPRDALARAGYPEAFARIGTCLAEALHYAHERGLLHLDLKPSNVLLAADGQPLLLDFHLAHRPLEAGRPAPEGLGGTPGYMSPEQEAACAAAGRGQPVPAAVDHRSDVYSLGRLLYEALGGRCHGDGRPLPPLYRCNPLVSRGLSDVVHHCLAASPDRRYPDAAALAADLRRHLAGLPLRGVPNRSLRERWQKWRRRRPHAPLWAGLLLALAAVPAVLGAVAVERTRDAREALRAARGLMQQGAHPEAERALLRARARVAGLPGCQSLLTELDDGLRRARRGGAARRLHAVCERLRFLVGADMLPPHELRALNDSCQAAWADRALLEGADEEQARADLIDLALLWPDLKRQLAPGDEATGQWATALLAEAEALCGPRDPGSAREQVALARSLMRSGELERAARALERAVQLRPQDFWAHFCAGACAYRRDRHADAVRCFDVALALAPGCPEVYYNRALAHQGAGDSAAALRDYGRALALAPAMARASLNRGALLGREGRWSEALADLEAALRHGAEPAAAHFNLALAYRALGRPETARHHLEECLARDPSHAGARALLSRERARSR